MGSSLILLQYLTSTLTVEYFGQVEEFIHHSAILRNTTSAKNFIEISLFKLSSVANL